MSEWTKVISKQRSMFYWFNTKTQETRWEEEQVLEDSDYITHFLEWTHCVMLSEVFQSLVPAFRDAANDQYYHNHETHDLDPYILHDSIIVDNLPNENYPQMSDVEDATGDAFHLEKTTLCMLGIPNPVLPKSLHSTFFIGIPSAFMCANRTQSDRTLPDSNFIFPSARLQHVDLKVCPRKPHVDILYLPFNLHEHMETEFTLRTLMHFAYSTVISGGYLIGMTLNPSFLHDIKHGQDQYARYWKTPYAKARSLTQRMWTNHTHSLSYGSSSSSDVLIRRGTSIRSKGWDTSKFPSMAKEYKFEVLEWSSIPTFYYKHANRYMKEFKTHVGYKLSTPTDWISMDMYQLFILRKL
jgi:hypothetical protein